MVQCAHLRLVRKVQKRIIMSDLMSAIKECNAYMKEHVMPLSAEEQFELFSTEEKMKAVFMPFFEKQDEVATIIEFVHLCRLDLQHNFIGGSTINKNGSTVIKIG